TVSAAVITAAAGAATAVRLLGLGKTSAAGSASGALPATVNQWTAQVTAAGADATALSRLATALPGNFGRYSRGATSGYLSKASAAGTDSLPELVALAATQRATIATAIDTVDVTMAALTVGSVEANLADAIASLLAALTGACADPADALRLLSGLLVFQPVGSDTLGASGAAVSRLFRLTITVELARASAAYQPSSYEDAFARLVDVTAAIDAAAETAGSGLDDLFAALRTLRVAVVEDLRVRGASLAHVRTFSLPAPLPALSLAQRLYRDAARADELVGEAGDACVSPLFMPVSLQALAA
ncbi:hypothetical protein, partial [Sphingomonas sp. S6]|uniref:hypothetical protein n=1 Tax=Sphingomonas sp. S6 TaxID=3368600 RepID=UPI00373E0B33